MGRWSRWVWVVLLVSGAVWAAPKQWPLKTIFGERNVGLVQTSRQAIVEFCPDDTCIRFILAGGDSLAILHDFSFLYLALVEGYDIEQIKGADGERHFARVLQRQRGACRGSDEAAVARCTLATMARHYPVRAYISRMEAGWRRSTPFDLAAALAAAGVH